MASKYKTTHLMEGVYKMSKVAVTVAVIYRIEHKMLEVYKFIFSVMTKTQIDGYHVREHPLDGGGDEEEHFLDAKIDSSLRTTVV